MNILAVDTSTMMSSISIMKDDKIIADYNVNQDQSHSEKLVILIKRVLNDVKMELNDIDLFAVAKGPGSFTGLRIGMTTIKAIAQALDKDIIGISTLEAMAFSVINDSNILSIIDARGKRYFSGFYKKINGKMKLEFEDIITEDKILEIVNQNENLVIIGDAALKLSDKIKKHKNVKFSPLSLNNGITKNVCVLAKERWEEGFRDSYFDLSPNYLRKSQAEINLGK